MLPVITTDSNPVISESTRPISVKFSELIGSFTGVDGTFSSLNNLYLYFMSTMVYVASIQASYTLLLRTDVFNVVGL